MPQTREHLAICQLLRIKSGLVVLSKADLAEPEWLELVRDDVRRTVADTFLADRPIVPVSVKTGAGLPELRAALAELARAVPPKDPDHTARLPIDRVFTVKGFGTVVTGTLVSGRLAIDGRVEVYPRGVQSKVRGLQVHGHAVEGATAGQRTAVNLQGVERAAIERGDVLAPAGTLRPTLLLDGTLELLEDAPRPIKTRDRIRFHAGTQEVMARVLPVGGAEIAPGGSGHARFRLEAPLVVLPGDRFVVRSYSPIVTVGGGTVLDVAPPRFKRKGSALAEHLALLATGGPADVLEEHLRQSGAAGARAARLRAQTLALLAAFHRENPLRAGISREELRSRVGQAQERVFAQLLGALESEGLVRSERDQVRLASHAIRLSPEQERVVKALEADFRGAGAAPPAPEEALARHGVKGTEKHELFQVLVSDRTLVRVKESLFFHAEALRTVQDRLVALLHDKKEIGPADFKDLFGVSRKYAIPLMEYFDAQRVTVRVGERRVLREGHGRVDNPGAGA
jgi:selenocysteine-specific elongation factor